MVLEQKLILGDILHQLDFLFFYVLAENRVKF